MQARDLENWASEMEREMLTEEPVHDVSTVDMLRKHHAEIKAEIDTREDTFNSVIDNGRHMVRDGHFASRDVSHVSFKIQTEIITSEVPRVIDPLLDLLQVLSAL